MDNEIKNSKEVVQDQDEEDDQKEYCVCRKLYSGRFMIQRDFCGE